jgi:hypothetical protein
MSITRGDKVEGNFGIYDQKLALEWIQRNIKVNGCEIMNTCPIFKNYTTFKKPCTLPF